MSDRFESDYRDDEPVIGGTYAPPAPPPPPGPEYIGGSPGIGFAPPPAYQEAPYAEDQYEVDEYYDEDSERPGEADLIISKHRNGAVGKVTLTFHKEYPRFMNYAGERYAS